MTVNLCFYFGCIIRETSEHIPSSRVSSSSPSLPIIDVWIWDFNKNRSDLVRVRGSFHFRRINWQFITREGKKWWRREVKNCWLISEKSSFKIQIRIALVAGAARRALRALRNPTLYHFASCFVTSPIHPIAAANFHSSMTFESLFFLCHNLFYLPTSLCVFRSALSADLSTIGTWKAFLNGFLISNRRQAFNDRNLMACKVFIKLILYEDLLNGHKKEFFVVCIGNRRRPWTRVRLTLILEKKTLKSFFFAGLWSFILISEFE